MKKVHSLIGRIDMRLMRLAFKAVKRNRGAAGVDRVSIKMFEANLLDNLAALMRELKSGSFQPRPLRRVYMPKNREKTEFRPLGIPVVCDRVAQEVLRRLLAPIFEPLFHAASFGFIQGRSAHMAINHALALHALGLLEVLDADIKGFFDNLPHRVVMNSVREKVADGKVLDLLERFLRCGVLEGGRLLATTRGTPQGGVISPLLANIVLNKLDWHLDSLGYRFVRYADDFIVLTESRSKAEEARMEVELLLETLGLALSPEKTKVTSYRKGYSFLGFVLSRCSRKIRPKSLEKFKDKVRALTVRSHNLDLDAVERLNRVLRGVAQYFCASFATNKEQFHKLDSWVRMRIRAMKFKRKNINDNRKLRNRTIKRLFRLLALEDFYIVSHANAC